MRSAGGRSRTGEGGPSDSGGGVYSVCERRCLDDRDVMTTSGAGAGANDTGNNARGDRVGEPLGSDGTEAHVPAALALAFAVGSASRCTMRFIRFLRGFFALDVVRSGDGWCDEGTGENTGLLEELAPLDGAGAIAVIGRVVGVAAPPTGTTGGEYALDKGRVEFICSGGGEVRLLLS